MTIIQRINIHIIYVSKSLNKGEHSKLQLLHRITIHVETKQSYIIHITASDCGYCSCEDSFSTTLKIVMDLLKFEKLLAAKLKLHLYILRFYKCIKLF